MLFGILSRRAPAIASHQQFRWRGEGVSRIEGLSDTVFGFAITLLVVSLEVPKNVDDLMTLAKGFVPFAFSFFILFQIWRAQFDFFRRYGLEDAATIRLTGALLVFVLFAIYPLKFLFTVMGAAMMNSDGPRQLKTVMPLSAFPKVLGLYGFGFFGIATVFSFLYKHAWSQREKLGLNALEQFDTQAMHARWQRAMFIGGAIASWCVSLLAIGDHMQRRDNLYMTVYFGGCAVILAGAASQLRLRRTIATKRRALALTEDQHAAEEDIAP